MTRQEFQINLLAIVLAALMIGVAIGHGGTIEPAPVAAFKVTWEPVLKSRMQYFTARHVATGRVLPRLKCAWCVSDPWAKLDPLKAAAAREAWAQATAQGVYDRLMADEAKAIYAESAEGVKAAKLAEATAAADTANQAAEAIAKIKLAYPLEKLPTVTVTAAALAVDEGVKGETGETGLLAVAGAGVIAAGGAYVFGKRRAVA